VVGQRTALINQTRGLLLEFGIGECQACCRMSDDVTPPF
jgi:hypothetical protein